MFSNLLKPIFSNLIINKISPKVIKPLLIIFTFIIELIDLGGREKLPDLPIITLIDY